MKYPLYASYEETEDEVIAYCDEVNAVASGKSRKEAKKNLLQSIEVMLDEYGENVKSQLKEKVITILEVA